MPNPLLAPAAVLVSWTLVMLFWLVARRLPAIKAAGIDLGKVPGARGVQLEGRVPDRVNWPAHNYSHLVEQPTLFYAVIAILVLAGVTGGVAVALAWGYVLVRIAHSLWQATVNVVPIRLVLFLVSTAMLIGLAGIALKATLIG
jgi:hypothetical protein